MTLDLTNFPTEPLKVKQRVVRFADDPPRPRRVLSRESRKKLSATLRLQGAERKVKRRYTKRVKVVKRVNMLMESWPG